MSDRPFGELLEATKRVASILSGAGVPFAVAGGIAAWARGGPAGDSDVDVAVRPRDAERALEALGDAGLKTEKPPEEWLHKAWCGDVLVDIVFRPEFEIDDEVLARAELIEVEAMTMPVMAVDDILVSKLLALDEHHSDFETLLEFARSLREQIDWGAVRERAGHSPFAKAYFVLLKELGIAPG